ncbi:hypothetical protein H4W80_006474 [Nonomuraea angiospora]|uniref:Uncharacterized protein n=1 Tax=Nonomuraea angiospora TaxID=46172 RepID=A0ABR9M5M4_9ACTN|nr:hypothetical protein [Nonomuraea angiospora]
MDGRRVDRTWTRPKGGLTTAWTGLRSSRACPARQRFHPALLLEVVRVWLYGSTKGGRYPAAQTAHFTLAAGPPVCRSRAEEHVTSMNSAIFASQETVGNRESAGQMGCEGGRAPGARTRNLRIKSRQSSCRALSYCAGMCRFGYRCHHLNRPRMTVSGAPYYMLKSIRRATSGRRRFLDRSHLCRSFISARELVLGPRPKTGTWGSGTDPGSPLVTRSPAAPRRRHQTSLRISSV